MTRCEEAREAVESQMAAVAHMGEVISGFPKQGDGQHQVQTDQMVAELTRFVQFIHNTTKALLYAIEEVEGKIS